MKYEVNPIGKIRSNKGRFYVELDKKYKEGLIGLEGFSYINIFWWAHYCDSDEKKIVKVNTPYKKAPKELGVFATRSPFRPNPIALTAAFVLKIDIENGIIEIPYIDAEDETPVIDIKPYHPCTDRVKNVSVPTWCNHWPKWYEDSAEFDWESEFLF